MQPGRSSTTTSNYMTPNPNQVLEARSKAGLTQTQAAELVSVDLRTWQRWEAGDYPMHPGLWELFSRKLEEL